MGMGYAPDLTRHLKWRRKRG